MSYAETRSCAICMFKSFMLNNTDLSYERINQIVNIIRSKSNDGFVVDEWAVKCYRTLIAKSEEGTREHLPYYYAAEFSKLQGDDIFSE